MSVSCQVKMNIAVEYEEVLSELVACVLMRLLVNAGT